jgi:hypothetical protein
VRAWPAGYLIDGVIPGKEKKIIRAVLGFAF